MAAQTGPRDSAERAVVDGVCGFTLAELERSAHLPAAKAVRQLLADRAWRPEHQGGDRAPDERPGRVGAPAVAIDQASVRGSLLVVSQGSARTAVCIETPIRTRSAGAESWRGPMRRSRR